MEVSVESCSIQSQQQERLNVIESHQQELEQMIMTHLTTQEEKITRLINEHQADLRDFHEVHGSPETSVPSRPDPVVVVASWSEGGEKSMEIDD